MSASAELQQLLSTPPPNLAPHLRGNPIAVAHARLEEIRDSGDPSFLFIRTIIENGTTFGPDQQELIFHCITGLRQVTLFQWTKYSQPFLWGLRDYLMVLGHAIPFRTVRLACYTNSVSIWKRLWSNTSSTTTILSSSPQEESLLQSMSNANAPKLQSQEDLFRYLEGLLSSTSMEPAAQFLDTLVAEFGARSVVNYRLPLEFHKEAHAKFEKGGPLTEALKLGMGALSKITADTQVVNSTQAMSQALAVVQLSCDCLSWEFGPTAFDLGVIGTSYLARTLLRPPPEWRPWLTQTDLLSAMFNFHMAVATQHPVMAQAVRQLILLLASISSAIFETSEDSQRYATCLLEGSQAMLNSAVADPNMTESPQLLDSLQIVSRLLLNFRLSSLVQLPSLLSLLEQMTLIGTQLLLDQQKDCEHARGDVDSMEHREWREGNIALILECAVTLSSDPWILYSGSEESRKQARLQLAAILGPLYEAFVACRVLMAALEEQYLVMQEAEVHELREEIEGVDLEEELFSASVVGRLHLRAAITCLSNQFQNLVPQLQSVWSCPGDITPQAAAILEQARLLSLYVGNLLTDSNDGESPAIPDAVIVACESDSSLARDIAGAVNTVLQLADTQIKKVAENPSNMLLSPLLAKSFVWLLQRWAPSYVCPYFYNASASSNHIVQEWSTPEKSTEAVSFCIILCVGYLTHWPHESVLHEEIERLVYSLSKRKDHVRPLLVISQSFRHLIQLHCLTAGIRHSASRDEFEQAIEARQYDSSVLSKTMVWGYHRLPYYTKSKILTALIIGCSDEDEASVTLISEILKVVHDSFTSLVNALQAKQVRADDVHAKEMASLCVHLFGGVVRAGEMTQPDRIPSYISGQLRDISALMTFYATDLSICESLLELFRDYAEQFLAILNRDQSLALFNATGELLNAYSEHHIKARVILKKAAAEAEVEEEQAYSDIQCMIQLLTNLGTKDFLDVTAAPGDAVGSTVVTDLIFYGLQQIIPLMTQGLLQFPTLCRQFFELLTFVMQTYPQKVCSLPKNLLEALLDAVLFGMSNHDAEVGKCALQGLSSLAREHVLMRSGHLAQHPEVLDGCSRRILTEVIFVPVVGDRLEAAGNALFALAATDPNRFASVLSELSHQVTDAVQKARLESAFTTLLQPEVFSKVSASGYEGRQNKIKFKETFQLFVNDVHSFLIIK